MTKDVLITVSGVQMDIGDEPIELVTVGTYYLKNGKHYVMYEEQVEDNGPITKNRVKFYDGHFEMSKKGGNNSFLMFERDRKTSTVYDTPFGSLQIDIMTKDLDIKETEDLLQVYVKYTLDINYNFISECEVSFKVQAR